MCGIIRKRFPAGDFSMAQKKIKINQDELNELDEAYYQLAGKKKAAAKKETAKKETVKKETAAKAPAKKAAVKKEAAKAPAKKAAAKKEVKIAIQFADKNYTSEDLANIANDVWVYDYNKKASELKDVQLYVKPEESKVYYVFNNEIVGDFNI